MSVEQTGGSDARPVTLTITDPTGADATDMDASCNNRKVVENTSAGNYRVSVVERRKADAWRGGYKLRFTAR